MEAEFDHQEQENNRETDLSLRQLQAELRRLDARIGRAVRRWQLAGQDPGDAFRGLYVSDVEAVDLLNRRVGANWGQTVTLDPLEEQVYLAAEHAAGLEVQQIAALARDQNIRLRLEHLQHSFGMDRFDLDALLICLAPCLDLRYERLYGYLQDDITRRRPGVNLILDLLAEPGLRKLGHLECFSADAPLVRHRLLSLLLQSGQNHTGFLGQELAVDFTVAAWLLGSYRPGAELAGHATLSWIDASEEDRLLAADVIAALENALPDRPILAFSGLDLAAQSAAARLIAWRLGQSLLQVDLAGLSEAGQNLHQGVAVALRDARLVGAIAHLAGWDACLVDGTAPPALLDKLFEHTDLAIVSGRSDWEPAGLARQRRMARQSFPPPGAKKRLELLSHYLNGSTPPESRDLANLAGSFQLSSLQIRDVIASAKDRAAQSGSPLQMEDLYAAARAHSNPRLAELARKIVPRYSWEDIVLPGDQLTLLREIALSVRGRPVVLDEWGVGRKLGSSRGVPALFSGPPGTGKTMAAEIIAGELELDLYKIDLSIVVSKYIGETEKNLEQIFREAESSNAILFFDEADALFGKRSEVRDSHDRYANIEISYLLQRMEAYDGVTILATNLRANLDEAFTRRLQFVVDFPFPGEADRLRIWQALFPPGVPRSPGIDFAHLAQRFKLSGGNIRNVIVSAAYLAASSGGVVTMEHLLHGTRRELQKMGKLVNEEELLLNALL